MQGIVTTIYGPDVNTDDIIRADILQETWDKRDFAAYAFDKYDPDFRTRCEGQTNVIVTGPNFGSGSSREQAVYAIAYNNVAFVVGERDPVTGTAYPDIFYRNAMNNGLPLVTLDDIGGIEEGDELSLDLANEILTNVTKGTDYRFTVPAADKALLLAGGIIGMARTDIEKLLA
ncbi:MAG: hypothetical protein KDJ15_02020 [Alphaproteobacteria bacterium]|nr:hypothetical protein [Alphaproteobacteria bacterium]